MVYGKKFTKWINQADWRAKFKLSNFSHQKRILSSVAQLQENWRRLFDIHFNLMGSLPEKQLW